MAAARAGLVYDDLERFPDDNLRRELIGGELIVTPAPLPRHQEAADELTFQLRAHTRQHGGRANSAPLDVHFAPADVVEPDVVYLAPEHLDRIGERYIHGAPDLVAEVSSPSIRHLKLVRKSELYQRYGVTEYWYVDLDAERVEVYRLGPDGRYGQPILLRAGDELTSPQLVGFGVPVQQIMGR